MRILIASPKIGGAFGQERVIRDSTALLRGAGHEVFLLGGEASSEVPECDGHATVPELWQSLSMLHYRTLQAQAENAVRAIDKFQPDLVHLVDISDFYLVNAVRENYPTVTTAHLYSHSCPVTTRLIEVGTESHVCQARGGLTCVARHQKYNCMSGFRNNLIRAHAAAEFSLKLSAQKRLRLIMAISEHVKETLLKNGVPPSMVRTVYNPIQAPMRKASSEKFPENLLVCASRLVQHKGVSNLIRAVGHLKKTTSLPWTLWVMGDGAERTVCEKLAAEWGVADRVSFLGRVSYERVQQTLFHARALIQPNLGPEPFGLSVAEALSAGVPAIVSDVPALNEIVTHEKTGLLYPANDVIALAGSIARLLEDRLLWTRLSEAGPESIRSRFSPEEHLRRTLDAYRFAVGAEFSRPEDRFHHKHVGVR